MVVINTLSMFMFSDFSDTDFGYMSKRDKSDTGENSNPFPFTLSVPSTVNTKDEKNSDASTINTNGYGFSTHKNPQSPVLGFGFLTGQDTAKSHLLAVVSMSSAERLLVKQQIQQELEEKKQQYIKDVTPLIKQLKIIEILEEDVKVFDE